jgi:hypothetical protein
MARCGAVVAFVLLTAGVVLIGYAVLGGTL